MFCPEKNPRESRTNLNSLAHAHFICQDAAPDLPPLLGDGPGQELLLEGQQVHQHLLWRLHLLVYLQIRLNLFFYPVHRQVMLTTVYIWALPSASLLAALDILTPAVMHLFKHIAITWQQCLRQWSCRAG